MQSLINVGAGRTLAQGVAKGLWSLEDLDKPSPCCAAVEGDRVASCDPCQPEDPTGKVPIYNSEGVATWVFPRPSLGYPPAPPFRNLARDWIEANPKAWAAMNGMVSDRVEASPSPRDLAPREGEHYPPFAA